MTETTLLNEVFPADNGYEEFAAQVGTASYFNDLIRTAYPRSMKRPGTAILFTSLERGSGVSYTCSSVAADLSGRGGEVLLADAEVVKMLGDRDDPSSYTRRVGLGRVSVLGPQQVRAAAMQASSFSGCVPSVVRLLRADFSSIVVDAPALSVSDVALELCALVQGVVLVARAGQTKAHALTQARTTFESLGAQVLGCVYNGH